jgi:hypothetical protein
MSSIKIYVKIHYFDTFLIKNTFKKCIALYYLARGVHGCSVLGFDS